MFAPARSWFAHLHHHAQHRHGGFQHDVMQTCVNFLGFPAQARAFCAISRPDVATPPALAALPVQTVRLPAGTVQSLQWWSAFCPFSDGFNAIGDKLMRGVNSSSFWVAQGRAISTGTDHGCGLRDRPDQILWRNLPLDHRAGFDFDKTCQFLFRESAFINTVPLESDAVITRAPNSIAFS